jgi:hypothetical protein
MMPFTAERNRIGRRLGIDQFAGLPPQFERTNPGWHFRRHGHGPAIRVSDEEHAAFLRSGFHAVLLHGAALPIFGGLAWLLLKRIVPTWNDNAIAAVFGIVLSLIALALHLSMRHHADAPARALALRSPEQPARDPDASMQPDYSTIVMLVLILLFLAAIGTGQPASFYFAFASGSVMLGLILTLRRWRFGRALTVAQRERLRVQAAEARARAKGENGQSFWQFLLLLVFIVIELAMLVGGMLLGVGAAQSISGQTSEEFSFGIFMLGFLPGLGLGALCFWPLDRLCKRWTGSSATDAFDWIPPSW